MSKNIQLNEHGVKLFTERVKSLFPDNPQMFKKGGKQKRLLESGGKPKIHIKKENKGKFTDYCGGKVTSECISKGKNSPNPTIRKRATFAANARKWNH